MRADVLQRSPPPQPRALRENSPRAAIAKAGPPAFGHLSHSPQHLSLRAVSPSLTGPAPYRRLILPRSGRTHETTAAPGSQRPRSLLSRSFFAAAFARPRTSDTTAEATSAAPCRGTATAYGFVSTLAPNGSSIRNQRASAPPCRGKTAATTPSPAGTTVSFSPASVAAG